MTVSERQRHEAKVGPSTAMDPFSKKGRVESRESRGRLVAQLLAGAWRSPIPSPFNPGTLIVGAGKQHKLEAGPTADELGKIAPLMLKSGAAGLAWRQIRNTDLIHTLAATQLQAAYRIHSLEAAFHERHLRKIVCLLRDQGAEPVLVKGWATARLYPEPGLRPYCDLDFCLLQDQYAAARAALKDVEALGAIIDLHLGFGKFYERQADRIFDRTRLIKLGDIEVRVLCPEDDLRFLCLHLLRHGAIRPLWLADIAVSLETRSNDFDWDRCLSASTRQVDWVACAIGLAHRLLGADIQGIPLGRRVQHLPSWLVIPTLKAWGTPAESPRQVATYLRHPIGLLKELRHHWPNPIEATMTVRGPFNELPRWPFQLGHVVSRTATLLSQLSGAR